MNVTIATAPCSWGVWYADGTPSGTPYPTFLDQAAEAGYLSLELGPDGYLPTDEGKLREELAARNLAVCAGTACYRFDQHKSFADFRPQVDALCRRLRAFDAPYLVTMDESDVGRYSEKKAVFPAGVWSGFLEKLRLMGEYTRDNYGVQVVYHPHIRSMIETEEEILRMMDHTGLDLCFDTGHHVYVNGGTGKGDRSALDFMERHAARIAYLHFKNMDGGVRERVARENLDSDAAFDQDVMCDLADGVIDFNALRDTLERIGFDGIGVIEQDMPRATTQQAFDAAKRNLTYLRQAGIIG